MPRIEYEKDEYNPIDANSQFEEYSVAKKQLERNLKTDNRTRGLISTASGSIAQSVVEQVRKKRD